MNGHHVTETQAAVGAELRRERAEEQVEEMAKMVAFECSRAEEAEARLRDLGY